MNDLNRKRRRRRRISNLIRRGQPFILLAIFSLLLTCNACSPIYVARAGWEEAGILLRRQEIPKIIENAETPPETRDKLQLVLDARAFTETIGLEPKGSFTTYSSIDRDVLVWVLSACPKVSLSPVTWWFPIVGNIPYKGFFEKDDGLAELAKLQKRNFDVYLRPSAAFSTLGWFNDPLLSTTLKMDQVDLANTVIHEVLHNTVWIKNDAIFNESLANFVGSRGVIEFLRKSEDPKRRELASVAEDRWADELVYAHFLDELMDQLHDLYCKSGTGSCDPKDPTPPKFHLDPEQEETIVAEREKLFSSAKERWTKLAPSLRSEHFRKYELKLNNAALLAQMVYMEKLWLFNDLFQACKESFGCFVSEMKEIEKNADGKEKRPYDLLEKRIWEQKVRFS